MDENETANMQSMSVKQAAEALSISQRSVYMARELMRTGRDDLIAAIKRGELSLNAALRQAKPDKYGKKSKLAHIQTAWLNLSEEDKSRFVAWLISCDDSNEEHTSGSFLAVNSAGRQQPEILSVSDRKCGLRHG